MNGRSAQAAVSSAHNRRVAAARKLLDSRHRAAQSAFLVEGPHAVAEALTSSAHTVRELFVTEALVSREVALLRTAARQDVPVTVVTDRVLASLGDTVTPQGVVAVASQPRLSLDTVLAASPRLVVVLHAVADPGNAGAVIRTADAAGADAVVLTAGSVDPYNGKSVRASAGSIFHVPVVVGAGGDAISDLQAAGLRVIATTLDASVDLDTAADSGELDGAMAWMFGNEAHGLPEEAVARADLCVRIPIRGRAESLNLAAAAAVCLFANARVHAAGRK